MSFSTLSGVAQKYISYFAMSNLKVFFVFMLIILSASYLFIFKRNEKPTPSLMFLILRIIITSLSFVILVTSPLFIFLLYPEVSFYKIFTPFIVLYVPFMLIALILFFIDFLRVGVAGVLAKNGFNIGDPKARKIYEELQRLFR